MALAVRSERAAAPRARQRAASSTPATRTPLVRNEVRAGSSRPALVVAPRRRRAARAVSATAVVIVVLMFGGVAMQLRMAQRQVTLDVLDRRIREAHQTYDVLRRERAELRSPGRLVEQATLLGMSPPTETEYVALEPEVVAAVQRSGSHVDGDSNDSIGEEFADYALVKSRAGGAP